MTYFTIPLMFLACLRFPTEPSASQAVDGFNFEQPVSIEADYGAQIRVSNVMFDVAPFSSCIPAVAHNSSLMIFENGLFNIRPGSDMSWTKAIEQGARGQ